MRIAEPVAASVRGISRRRSAPLGRSTAGAGLAVAVLVALAVSTGCAGGSKTSTDGTGSLLSLTIDSPDAPSVDLPLRIAGWGADFSATVGPGIEMVDVLDGGCSGPPLGSAKYGIPRPDVARNNGDQFIDSGWELDLETLSAGEHGLAVRMRSSLANASVCETVTVTVLPHPVLSIEAPSSPSVLLPVRLGGWGADLAAAEGAGVDRVDVLDGGCEGELLGEAEYGITRGDVARRYGDRFGNSGWQLVLEGLSSGEHVLGVLLFSKLSDASVCQTKTITVL